MSEYRLVMAKGVIEPGVKALDTRSWAPPGKVMALLGENSASKSTPDEMYVRHLQDGRGRDQYEGEKVNILNSAGWLNAGIAMVHQELPTYPGLVLWLRTSGWAATPPRRLAPSIVTTPRCIRTPTNCSKSKLDIKSHAKLGTLVSHRCRWWRYKKAVSKTARC